MEEPNVEVVLEEMARHHAASPGAFHGYGEGMSQHNEVT
jgi:hypothetical protein